MLRAWLREMRTSLLGRRATPRPAGRPRRTARLGLECLEGRDLLSGGVVPGYSLDSSGNLYNTAGAQPLLIDTGVEKFSVRNNKVYALEAGGSLASLNSDGSGKA